MLKSVTKCIEYLDKQPRRIIVSAGAVLALLISVSEFLMGRSFGFSIFYLIPIAVVTWYAGRKAGIFVASFSAATWLAADILSERSYTHVSIPFWNAAVRLGFFIIVVFLLYAFKREKSYAREDYLTGLGNRRHFFEMADGEIKRSRRYGHPFTLAYIDVDDFKSINDNFGHAEGDALLQAIGQAVTGNIRATDIAARLGGDEFAVLLPESDAVSSRIFFSKLHQRLSDVVQKKNWPVTFSIGVVTFTVPPASIDEMIRAVDRLMYSAKNSGKNLVKYEVVEK